MTLITSVLRTVAGLLIGLAISFFIARQLNRSGWHWRLGIKSSDAFLLPFDAPEVLADFHHRGRQRGWRTIDANDETVRMQAGMNMITWRRRISVSAKQGPDGTWVTVKSISPQLYDWGDNRRTVATVRRELERTARRI